MSDTGRFEDDEFSGDEFDSDEFEWDDQDAGDEPSGLSPIESMVGDMEDVVVPQDDHREEDD